MQYRLTRQAERAVEYARDIAEELHHTYVGTEHLMLGLIRAVDGLASKVLLQNDVTEEQMLRLIQQLINDGNMMSGEVADYTPRARRVLECSSREAARLNQTQIGTEHLLIALLKEKDCIALRLLNTLGVSIQKIYSELLAAMGMNTAMAKEYMAGKNNGSKEKNSALESYSMDLTRMAKEGKLHDMINLAADEPITIPKLQEQEGNAQATRQEPARMPQSQNMTQDNDEKNLEERLEVLSDRLEKSLGGKNPKEPEAPKGPSSEELNFVRILYSTLLKNEVSEQYVNQILGEIEKFIRPGHSVDTILSNVYQKLILRFGQPKSLDLSGAKPHVVFFIGPTGVGKTTTIAKIASKYKVDYEKKVAFITADTYRIAATEQLQVYANILDAPMSIVYSKEELNEAIGKYAEYDLVFVDTAGFSHKNEEQKEDIRNLIQGVDPEYTSEVYLVLSATTKYRDLLDIVDTYRTISEFKLIFTKLDETSTYGNLLNIKLYSDAELSYTTNGQNVPDDIELFDTQKIVKQLLGGNS